MSLQCCYLVFVSRFQSFIVLSLDPLAKRVPWGLNTTEVTQFSCPSNVAISVFVSKYYHMIHLRVPLWLNATDST